MVAAVFFPHLLCPVRWLRTGRWSLYPGPRSQPLWSLCVQTPSLLSFVCSKEEHPLILQELVNNVICKGASREVVFSLLSVCLLVGLDICLSVRKTTLKPWNPVEGCSMGQERTLLTFSADPDQGTDPGFLLHFLYHCEIGGFLVFF